MLAVNNRHFCPRPGVRSSLLLVSSSSLLLFSSVSSLVAAHQDRVSPSPSLSLSSHTAFCRGCPLPPLLSSNIKNAHRTAGRSKLVLEGKTRKAAFHYSSALRMSGGFPMAAGEMVLPDMTPSFTIGSDSSMAAMEDADAAIILIPEAMASLNETTLEKWVSGGEGGGLLFPHADVLARMLRTRQRREVNPKQKLAGCFLAMDLPNAACTRAVLVAVKDKMSTFEHLRLSGLAMKEAMTVQPRTIAVLVVEGEGEGERLGAGGLAGMQDGVVSAAVTAAGRAPSLKSHPPPPNPLRSLSFLARASEGAEGAGVPLGGKSRSLCTAKGTNLVRFLTDAPASALSPLAFRALLAALARKHGWAMAEMCDEALEGQGCGAFLAVVRASPPTRRHHALVRLRWTPQDEEAAARAPIALVGKGVCFDTGGVNVKGAGGMYGMKKDMSGAAAAVGTMLALSEYGYSRPVECFLAIADNLIGPDAFRPDDVVTACDGTTIEVVHTDAEGRMLLADALAIASAKVSVPEERWTPPPSASAPPSASSPPLPPLAAPPPLQPPALLLDMATLTGAAKMALSSRYAAVFSNRKGAEWECVRSGERSGERLWPFPLDPDYEEALDSNVADTLQCTVSSEADHILAAAFLNKFVPEGVPWLHVDLASAAHPSGLAHVQTAVTGFGVRAAAWLLLDSLPALQAPASPSPSPPPPPPPPPSRPATSDSEPPPPHSERAAARGTGTHWQALARVTVARGRAVTARVAAAAAGSREAPLKFY